MHPTHRQKPSKVRMRTFFIFLLAGLFLVGCKPKSSGQSDQRGFILGPSSDIERYSPETSTSHQVLSQDIKNLEEISFSIPIIATREKADSNNKVTAHFCSGAIINHPKTGIPTVLTNYHCFAKTQSALTSKATYSEELLDEACDETKVVFGHRIDSKERLVLNCKPGTLKGRFRADVMTFELMEDLPKEIIKFDILDADINIHRDTFVFHYPDIKENYKDVPEIFTSLPLQSITENDCKLAGPFPTNEWDLDPSLYVSLRSQCDIAQGSSGSAVIDKETLMIAGIHWGGIEIKYGNESVATYNAAVSSDYLTEFLKGNAESTENALDAQPSKDRIQNSQSKNTSAVSKLVQPSCGSVGGSMKNEEIFYFLVFFIVGLPLLGRRKTYL